MYCEITKNGSCVRGPFHYKNSVIKEVMWRLGYDVGNLPVTLTMPIVLGDISIMPVIYNKPPYHDRKDYVLQSRVVTESSVTYNYSSYPRNPDALRLQLKEKVSGRHNLYEMDYAHLNGVAIKADLEARVNAAETLKQFKNGKFDGTSIKWRGKNGKIPINTTADMEAVYDVVFNYLMYGFAAKEVAEEEIDVATDVDLQNIDPTNTFNLTLNALNGV